MSVNIEIPIDRVKGHSFKSGNTFYTEDTLTVDIQPIPPGVNAKLSVRGTVAPKAGSSVVTATLGEGDTGYSTTRNLNFTRVVPQGASKLTIMNTRQVTFSQLSLILEVPDREDLEPWEIVGLDIYAPPQEGAALYWDNGRWNNKVWNQANPTPASMSWNKSAWDMNEWYDSADKTLIWQSILEDTLTVTVSRSISALSSSASVGLLTVELKGAKNDPRTLGISIGAPVRFYLKQTLTRIFTGNLISSTIVPDPIDHKETRVTLVFADAVGTLTSITRYGAKADFGDGSETFQQRGHRLSKSAKALTFSVDSSNERIAPTVWETSLANHLDALVSTTGGYWTVTRENVVKLVASQPTGVSGVVMSDVATPGALYYTYINETWNTADLVTSIESTTHAAIRTSDGWEAADRTLTVEAETQVATWQGAKETVDLLTPLAGSAQRDATARLLKRATQHPAVGGVSFQHSRAPKTTYQLICELDPAQIVEVIRAGEKHRLQIREVSHTFTPVQINTDITF